MEELKYRLGHERPSVVTLAVKRLHELIIAKKQESSDLQLPELGLVWSEFKGNNVLSSISCAHLLVDLVIEGHLDASATLNGLLASASQVQCPEGLVASVGRLLKLTKVEKGSFGIGIRQHPFVSLLRSSPTKMWAHVSGQVDQFVNDGALTAMRPVFLFAFVDPHHHVHFAPLRAALGNLLLDLSQRGDREADKLLKDILEWATYDTVESLSENSILVLQVLQRGLVKHYLPLVLSLALKTVDLGLSPQNLLDFVQSKIELVDTKQEANVCTIILAQLFQASPYVHLADITKCVQFLVDKKGLVDRLPAAIFITELLQSMAVPSKLTSEMSDIGGKLVYNFYTSTKSDDDEQEQMNAFAWDPTVAWAIQTVQLTQHLLHEKAVLQWLSDIEAGDSVNLTKLFPLLSALMLTNNSGSVLEACLKQLLRCVQMSSTFAPPLLTLLMHKMSVESKPKKTVDDSSTVPLALLNSLPCLAVDKCCIGLLLQLLDSLKAKPGLSTLHLKLLYDLWLVEERCYPHLQRALEQPSPTLASHREDFLLAKAKVIHDVCKRRPSQYGADLLRPLSELLNTCNGEEGTTVCTLALDGIGILCQEGIIDMMTTVKVLSPKLKKDERPRVVSGFYALLSIGPSFHLESNDYQGFLKDSLEYLWGVSYTKDNKEMRLSAVKAISKFSLEHHSLKMMPPSAKEGLELPTNLRATPPETDRLPEDVLDYVPGDCWVNILCSVPEDELGAYEGLLATLVKEEVAVLPRSVYHLSQSMKNRGSEPPNYNYLQETSLLRAVVSYLLRHIQGLESHRRNRATSCLKILAEPLERPLPPLDWSSLKPLKDTKGLISVVSMQCQQSNSARSVIESIMGESSSAEIALDVFPHFAKIIQAVAPQVYNPFINNTLQLWMVSAMRDSKARGGLVSTLKAYSAILRDDTIPEESTASICQALEKANDEFPADEEELYRCFLNAVAELPLSNLDKMSNPLSWWEVTDIKIYRALSIRSTVACLEETESPMVWLNNIIDVLAKQQADSIGTISYDSFLRTLFHVVSKTRVKRAQNNVQWLLELMGQIRSVLRQGMSEKSGSFHFLFDVFTSSLIAFSEVDNLVVPRDDKLCLYSQWKTRVVHLPLAIDQVLQIGEHWPRLGPPLAEWLLQIKDDAGGQVSKQHKAVISNSLSAFKRTDKYGEASMWSRLVPLM